MTSSPLPAGREQSMSIKETAWAPMACGCFCAPAATRMDQDAGVDPVPGVVSGGGETQGWREFGSGGVVSGIQGAEKRVNSAFPAMGKDGSATTRGEREGSARVNSDVMDGRKRSCNR